MKKTLRIAIIATSLLGLGSLSSCQDEDFEVSTQTLKERAFNDAFIKQFGKPDANQSWDFYAQTMESVRQESEPATRIAGSGAGWKVTVRDEQPDYISPTTAAQYSTLLPERQNNYTIGQTQYTLVATGSGKFTISAILYAGVFELFGSGNGYANTDYNFHLYLCFYDSNKRLVEHSIFEGRRIYHTATEDDFINPGYSVDVELTPGTEFWFELGLTRNSTVYNYSSKEAIPTNYANVTWPNGSRVATGVAHDYYHNYNGPSQLLYSQTQYGTDGIKRFMVIGFEDSWDWLNYLDFDYNDVVLYIDGDIPVPQAKRFMAEDLEAYDWDYNDVVFDVEYRRVVLRAVGGTLPLYLGFYNRETQRWQVSDELHEIMAKGQQPAKTAAEKIPGTDWYKPINVGADNGVDNYLPAIALVWSNPLSAEQLEKIGTETVTIDGVERGDIELLVGTGADQTEISEVNKHTSITYAKSSDKCPAIIMSPVSAQWLKERMIITSAYPTFYDGNIPASGTQTVNDYWYAYGVISGNLYNPASSNP